MRTATLPSAMRGRRDTRPIKVWAGTKKEGSVTDRICLAANLNQTPEYLSYVDILGGEFDSWAKLKALLKPLQLSYFTALA